MQGDGGGKGLEAVDTGGEDDDAEGLVDIVG